MSNPILLDDEVLYRLSQNPLVRQEFAFMNLLPVRHSGCCGQMARTVRSDLNSVKAAVANLPPERLRRFMEMAGLTEVKVVYNDGSGVAVRELSTGKKVPS